MRVIRPLRNEAEVEKTYGQLCNDTNYLLDLYIPPYALWSHGN